MAAGHHGFIDEAESRLYSGLVGVACGVNDGCFKITVKALTGLHGEQDEVVEPGDFGAELDRRGGAGPIEFGS